MQIWRLHKKNDWMNTGMLTTTEICQSHGLDFTRFTLLNEAPQKGCKQSGRRLTRIQTTSHPDYIWP